MPFGKRSTTTWYVGRKRRADVENIKTANPTRARYVRRSWAISASSLESSGNPRFAQRRFITVQYGVLKNARQEERKLEG